MYKLAGIIAFKRFALLSVFIFISFFFNSFSYPAFTERTKKEKKKRALVHSTHVLGYGGSLAALYKVWYSDFDRTKLHGFDDSKEWGGMDKVGHLITSFQLANASNKMYKFAGIKDKNAALIGSSVSLFYLTTLEFFDGFSAKWGFSFYDMGANVIGTSVAYLKNTGILKNINLKYSWHNTKYPAYRPDILGNTIFEKMLKDYNGQTYWLSINLPKKLFSDSSSNWLCLSFGYSIDGFTGGKANYFDSNLINPPVFKRIGEFYFSVDIDPEKLNIRSKFLKKLLKFLNVIKIPAPAIGITTNGHMQLKAFYF